ncbi:hypothetical protein GMRT_10089 [Giardia muris]|uniref:Uncharacterized protein n=1 Tax=Giardia muris TaxID=5742 RepID=A0A4Z1SKP0_GIAMU|nr:hypothetical protein GMRT_10089 [Giardia muris]|eukprot:TNJ26206.1 hypothetical protein GMRT_10089 [Giardia muris]
MGDDVILSRLNEAVAMSDSPEALFGRVKEALGQVLPPLEVQNIRTCKDCQTVKTQSPTKMPWLELAHMHFRTVEMKEAWRLDTELEATGMLRVFILPPPPTPLLNFQIPLGHLLIDRNCLQTSIRDTLRPYGLEGLDRLAALSIELETVGLEDIIDGLLTDEEDPDLLKRQGELMQLCRSQFYSDHCVFVTLFSTADVDTLGPDAMEVELTITHVQSSADFVTIPFFVSPTNPLSCQALLRAYLLHFAKPSTTMDRLLREDVNASFVLTKSSQYSYAFQLQPSGAFHAESGTTGLTFSFFEHLRESTSCVIATVTLQEAIVANLSSRVIEGVCETCGKAELVQTLAILTPQSVMGLVPSHPCYLTSSTVLLSGRSYSIPYGIVIGPMGPVVATLVGESWYLPQKQGQALGISTLPVLCAIAVLSEARPNELSYLSYPDT